MQFLRPGPWRRLRCGSAPQRRALHRLRLCRWVRGRRWGDGRRRVVRRPAPNVLRGPGRRRRGRRCAGRNGDGALGRPSARGRLPRRDTPPGGAGTGFPLSCFRGGDNFFLPLCWPSRCRSALCAPPFTSSRLAPAAGLYGPRQLRRVLRRRWWGSLGRRGHMVLLRL